VSTVIPPVTRDPIICIAWAATCPWCGGHEVPHLGSTTPGSSPIHHRLPPLNISRNNPYGPPTKQSLDREDSGVPICFTTQPPETSRRPRILSHPSGPQTHSNHYHFLNCNGCQPPSSNSTNNPTADVRSPLPRLPGDPSLIGHPPQRPTARGIQG